MTGSDRPAHGESGVPGPAAAPLPNDTLARIRALAGTPTCTVDSQCHSLALGARPCGGPERYLVWSSATAPADEIRALGELYAAERRQANEKSGLVSTCQAIPDPGAICRAGTCVPGAAANPPVFR